MQRLLIITILFLTSLTFINCNRSKTETELINSFAYNKPKLTAIVNNIQADKTLDSLFSEIGAENGIPDIKTSYPKLYDMIKEVGITDASAHKGACPEITIFTREQEIAAAKADSWRKAHFRRK